MASLVEYKIIIYLKYKYCNLEYIYILKQANNHLGITRLAKLISTRDLIQIRVGRAIAYFLPIFLPHNYL